MAKVTSKLQLTVPKAIADQYGIRPGDELQWVAAGDAIRVIPVGKNKPTDEKRTAQERLELFDQATQRQRRRQAKAGTALLRPRERGWKREELYDRGGAD
jgi:AbrB family looped-hinge helix DNA binding protein